MKQITIAGTVGKDAQVRRTQDGDPIAGWSVAVNSKAGGQEVTTWFECSLFGKRGEALAQYIRKGGKVTVSGDLSTREYDGKTYLQVRVNEVALQGDAGGRRDDRDDAPPPRERATGGAPAGRHAMDDGDEIPFMMEWR
jgi:single-strand DNA-binding protein